MHVSKCVSCRKRRRLTGNVMLESVNYAQPPLLLRFKYQLIGMKMQKSIKTTVMKILCHELYADVMCMEVM